MKTLEQEQKEYQQGGTGCLQLMAFIVLVLIVFVLIAIRILK